MNPILQAPSSQAIPPPHRLRTPVFALINPKSGAGLALDVERRLVQRASDHQVELIVQRTDSAKRDAAASAIEAGAKTIVVVGGDGTISKAASHAAKKNVDVGIVPTGTANLIAKSLAIPEDPMAAVDGLFGRHRIAKIDGMVQNENIAFSHVSMGTYSRIAQRENCTTKRYFGKFAYLLCALREVVIGRDWAFEISIDGQTQRRRASLIMVANVRPLGIGELVWGEHIDPSDGALDVCLVRAKGLRRHASLFYHAWRGNTAASNEIEYFRAKSTIQVHSIAGLPVRADGEVLNQTMIDIRLRRAVLSVIVPSTPTGN
ncbi:diacylglycerol kinase family protein [Roseiconus lacunae]|uniref:diacylglycerol/lipid kinase family protein n=1 Tax=Roseiconus lacunae TaxID=2605694 RepID=UPI003089994E|nr:diacylglycerol kinase family protein [Stieleria sp. HD01]